jgi:uncharacterized protein YjbJ (UPF0337 family)
MIVIVGLVVLIVAVIVGFTGVLANAGAAHPLTENFALFGYHVTGSTGTLFVSGIAVSAVAMLGLSVLLAGARRTAGRGRDSRHELQRSQRETAFLNQERDQLLTQQQAGKKITHKTQAANGAVKKYIGRATGNTRLHNEGRADQFTGNTRQAGAKVKDAFKH